MAKRKYKISEEVIDPDTGDVVGRKNFLIVDKSADTDYVKLYKACTRAVLNDLQGNESIKLKVLWWFLDKLQDGPFGKFPIYASTGELAKQLGCSEVAIKKARAYLLKHKYLFRHVETSSKKVARNYYVLNPKYVHKGKDIFDSKAEVKSEKKYKLNKQ